MFGWIFFVFILKVTADKNSRAWVWRDGGGLWAAHCRNEVHVRFLLDLHLSCSFFKIK